MTKANVVYLYDKTGKIIYAANTLLEIRNEINRLNLLTYKEYINLKKYGYVDFRETRQQKFENCEIIEREYWYWDYE